VTAKKFRSTLLVTQRAIRDLADIETCSISQWGESAAARYLADIEAAMVRIQKSPQLLRPEEGLHPSLLFYRVNKHLLVCDRTPQAIILLTVMHASRDIPSRLGELEPSLHVEVELLREQFLRDRKR
jgi:plasmid stabilization system protein ParE